MRTVWKEPLALSSVPQAVKLPTGAKIVHVAEQHSLIALWVEVDVDDDGFVDSREERTFVVVGTGHPIPSGFTEHVGTVFIGAFVFHVYESLL